MCARQVHFPDHTKLALSASGTSISATLISPEAAAYLRTHADLLPHHVSSREVHTDTISSLLHEGGRVRARIVKANAVKEKLEFVARVVGQWVGNGGLGRLDEDGDVGVPGGEGVGLEWEGLAVGEGGARRGDRVTVGRYGGDDGSVRGEA